MQRDFPLRLLEAKREALRRFLFPNGQRAFISQSSLRPRAQLNVVGVGIGIRPIEGTRSCNQIIRIYVERKFPEERTLSRYFPEKIGMYNTDVVETGRFQAFSHSVPILQRSVPPPQRRLRPAKPGCSIGFRGPASSSAIAGTLGALVKKKDSLMILSANHVLANENRLKRGTAIFQPSPLDGGIPSRDQIARLGKFISLSRTRPNLVDCATAELMDNSLATPAFLPPIGALKRTNPVDAVEGMRVHKVGRTTGYTRGTVFDISADVNVEYEMGVLSFQDQILVQADGGGAFSAAGDSGSVIVDRTTGQATGLLFGGSESFTIANHLRLVLRKLQVRLAG